MFSLEDLNARVDAELQGTSVPVSAIYMEAVYPHCSATGSFDDFLRSPEILARIPASLYKIRSYLLQIMVLMGISVSREFCDPLPQDEFAILLQLVQTITPLCGAFSGTMLVDFFSELEATHGNFLPMTIMELARAIGLTSPDRELEEVTDAPERIHYDDGKPENANKTLLRAFPMFRESTEGRTVTLKVSKKKVLTETGHFARRD